MNTTMITVRLDNAVLQEIDSKCNTKPCSRSDFVKNAINDALESKKEPIPMTKIKSVSYDDGKTWIDLD